MPGYCPECGKSLDSGFTSEYHSRSANYSSCIICGIEYCYKCAPYSICPNDFKKFSPEDQKYIARNHLIATLQYKVGIIGSMCILTPVLIYVALAFLNNGYLTLLFVLLSFIVLFLFMGLPFPLYKKKVLARYSQIEPSSETMKNN